MIISPSSLTMATMGDDDKTQAKTKDVEEKNIKNGKY
jgi:hypothetical protein